jgi:hypothetical protein
VLKKATEAGVFRQNTKKKRKNALRAHSFTPINAEEGEGFGFALQSSSQILFKDKAQALPENS